MKTGRSRTRRHGMPEHINHAAVPAGLYWDNGRWFVYEPHPEGGRPRKVTVARGHARLSELEDIIAARAGRDVAGTLGYLIDRFQESLDFSDLSADTQRDYRIHAKVARDYVLKDGTTLGVMQVERMTVPLIQRIVNALACGREAAGQQPALKARPSTANHTLRFVRMLFGWGIRLGYCRHNPAKGVKQAKERGDNGMPDPAVFEAVLQYAKVAGARKAHTRGSVAPYVYPVMLLAYNLRLRRIEVTTLTDAHADEVGIRTNRRKGSRDNHVQWNADLRDAWSRLKAYRSDRWEAHRRQVPIRPSARLLLVSEDGYPLTRSGLDSAMQRLMASAVTAKVITADQAFSLHGLKHRGITDTPGDVGVKQTAAGHVERRMTLHYDHDLPVVQAPTRAKVKAVK